MAAAAPTSEEEKKPEVQSKPQIPAESVEQKKEKESLSKKMKRFFKGE